ncbi:MAG: hypothetical protein EOO51_09170 [Flavobacterium sp.]|nr:MAG: hypothetical protein EOO51_09170 [Flavobacterium sp.]
MSIQIKKIGILCVALLCAFPMLAQQTRPKIGLTLSGGGAKGIAHIGLLKAIDSAGIRIDYVTGTSMGAVVGGLYAAGYSGDELSAISKKLEWLTLLSNDPLPYTINLKERKDFGQYVEFPLNKGRLSLKRGFIESNELWLALAELYYPYYQIEHFSQFDKSFQCIATDVATGKMVVLKEGNIVDAVRASMAIPSVFTPVEIKGKILIDGGMVRNFPVSNVRELGADIVIGSDVSGALDPVEQIESPLDIISRLPFYNAVSDLEEQKKQVDIYVDYDLGNYGTSSFASAKEILDIGTKKGIELYPKLKKLQDSLDLIYGPKPIRLPQKRNETVVISGFTVQGLDTSKTPGFLSLLGLVPDSPYSGNQITEAIRTVFATRIYRSIHYSLLPNPNGSAQIIFDVEEAPSTSVRFGAHYNATTGIGLKLGLVKKGFLSQYSIAAATLSIGENPRGEATFMYYLGKKRKMALQAQNTFETTDINTYDAKFSESGLYNQSSQNSDLQLIWQPTNNWTISLGTSLTNVSYEPKISSQIQANGRVSFLNTYVQFEHSSLDTPVYPNRGRRLSFKGGIVYSQLPEFTIHEQDSIIATEKSPFFNSKAYGQVKVAFEQYIPVGKNAVFAQLQSGVNFGYRQAILNDFRIGGLTNVIRNQVTFAGLPESAIFSASVVSAQVGYQHAITPNLFLIGKVNALWYDFIKSNFRFNETSHGIGYSLTGGYKTFLGPIEASLMYSDLNKKVLPYFNIGYILTLD